MAPRALRGVLGTTLTWTACWALLGLVLGVISGAYDGLLTPHFVGRAVVLWGAFGAVAGCCFALTLRVLGRRVAGLHALTFRRAAGSGVGGGVALALMLFGLIGAVTGAVPPGAALLVYVGVGAVLGGGMAAGSLAVARRAPRSLGLAGGTRRLEPPAI